MSDEIRDIGPFQDADQARQQFANWSRGIPEADTYGGIMAILEGALIAGVKLSPFETNYLTGHGVDPVVGTILSGLLIRAAAPERFKQR